MVASGAAVDKSPSAERAKSTSIYLAARYSRNGEMRDVRDVLVGLGYTVTSSWIDLHPDVVGNPQLQSSLSPALLNDEPERCGRFAQIDVDDVVAADAVISFTSPGEYGKGGRHVEFGLALGLGKRLILVGGRENVFHTLPQVEHYPDLPQLLVALVSGETETLRRSRRLREDLGWWSSPSAGQVHDVAAGHDPHLPGVSSGSIT